MRKSTYLWLIKVEVKRRGDLNAADVSFAIPNLKCVAGEQNMTARLGT